jgi:host factor-I protein
LRLPIPGFGVISHAAPATQGFDFWGGNAGETAPYSAKGPDRADKRQTQEQRFSSTMASDRQNLQDAFLNQVRKTKIPVTVFLINGVKLQGVITWFDNFCILLRRDGQSQLVYKHAVSTIMPSQPVSLYDGDDQG